jgi:hypothetical protein
VLIFRPGKAVEGVLRGALLQSDANFRNSES